MKIRLPLGRLAVLVFTALVLSGACRAANPARDSALAATDALIANPAYADYRGWLKYLEFRATADAERHGEQSAEAAQALERLRDWTTRIGADPALLSKLRGIQEWAYESPADGSGQPFRINIPTDYEPAKATPLSLYAHGYSGSHVEHTSGWTEKTGSFDIAVLGRARGGFYRALSGADVMDVLAYVRAHWNIDPERIRINGGSMGGFGSYWFSSRHPDIFASARPDCGFALESPLGNLLHTPVYAIHSSDDPVVSILLDKVPMKALRARGGAVTYEEINGFGHAAWDFGPGNARAGEWESRQVLVPSREIRDIDFTALDASSAKGWWASVERWGNEPRPARMILSARPDNTLYATLDNVDILEIDTASSPLDPSRELRVSVDGGVALALPAPLPAKVLLGRTANGWAFLSSLPESPRRLHTPGGAENVYDGSPILIVYGTTGTSEETAALKLAATQASKSPNCSWPDDAVDPSPIDGISHYELLYGNLPVKADRDVTDADIAGKNLVLIGTASQNALVSRLSQLLPVSLDKGTVRIGEERIDAKGAALALVYANPLAQKRLVLWFASEDVSFYRPGALLPQMFANAPGADFALMAVDSPRLLTARAFDSDWNWTAVRDNSPLLPADCLGEAKAAEWLAGVFAKAAHADRGARMLSYGLLYRKTPALSFTPGLTRRADAALFFYNRPILKAVLSGAELRTLSERLAAAPQRTLALFPAPDGGNGPCSLALTPDDIWALSAGGAVLTDAEWTSLDAESVLLGEAE